MSITTNDQRRWVLLLETDERAGLVAAISRCCAEANVSLEITTGPQHVLLTCRCNEAVLHEALEALRMVDGVASVQFYEVIEPLPTP